MNVSGIRPYSGFYQYNSIRLVEQLTRSRETTQTGQDGPDGESAEEELRSRQEKEIAEASAKQTFSSYDFAQQYRPDEEFEMKGAESDINSLDVERAVSDLGKDQVIKQYQYFVRPRGSAEQQDGVPAVSRGAEDFSL